MDTPTAANYLARAKEFLKGSRSLRAAPLALLAVTGLHAATTRAVVSGPITFAAPNSTSVTECGASGGSSIATPLSGALINAGHGISLSGAARMTISGGTECVMMRWSGTGSGIFDSATMPLKYDFSIAGNNPPALTVTGWSLVVTLNSTPSTFTCSTNCSGAFLAAGTVATPGIGNGLSTWSVVLRVNGTWTALSTLTVNVPVGSSIDLNAAVVAPPAAVPAVGNTVFALLAAGLLAMGSAYLRRPIWNAPPR